MSSSLNLHIYEEVFLLALRDKEGVPFSMVNYRHALSGAIVAELLLDRIATVETIRRTKYLKLQKPDPTGDEILDDCIGRMKNARRRAQIKTWVQRFSGLPRMKTRVAQLLCRKKILKEEEGKILFIFRHRKYPEVDPRPEKAIISRMERAIFGASTEIDAETIVLISICKSTGLLNKLFDRKRLKEKKQRIKKLTEGELIGKATQDAIEAVQAAIFAAVVIPAVVAGSN